MFQAIVLYSEMASPSDLARRFLWVQRKLDTFKTVIGVEGVMTIINSVKEALTAVFSHPLYVKLCDQLGAQDTSLAYLGVNKMKWPLLESRRFECILSCFVHVSIIQRVYHFITVEFGHCGGIW